MTDTENNPRVDVDKYEDFNNDLNALCDEVANGLDPKTARELLAGLVKKHGVPELLAKTAASVLEAEIARVNKARQDKKGPHPDPMLDSSLQNTIEQRVRKRLKL